jgi:cytochrome c biogenesis protein
MTNTNANEKTIIDRVWDLFASVKLAAITFGLIAISSIIGTVIEQGAEPEKNLEVLSKLFGEGMAPTLYRISEALGFMDMYHSWWFITFLVIFTANLVICSLDRLPKILKIVKQPVKPLSPDKFRSYSIKSELTASSTPDNIRDDVRASLKKFGFNAHEVTESGSVQLYSQKGGSSRLGVYITHLSVILILIGAVIGIFFGFNGFLNLPEGYTSEVAYSRRGGTAHPLGFSIKCDDFDVEYYKGKDMPKDYRSWLTVTRNGQVVKKQMIEVNSPLRFEGYTFYQSSYGLMPNPEGVLVINAVSNTGASEVINTNVNGSFKIPGTDIEVTVTEFSPAIAFRQDGSTFTYGDMMTNPGIHIAFSINGQEYDGWILKRYPQTWVIPGGNRVEFIDYWGAQYTGLQVRKDPGVWIVYLGCVIMAIGLYSAFFMSHKKIWVSIAHDGKNGSKIMIAATANKNRPSFEKDVDKFAAALQKQL